MSTEMIITLQARLPRDLDTRSLAALDAYGTLFSQASRHYLVDTLKRVNDKTVPAVKKSDFMLAHGLTGRQLWSPQTE